MEAILLTWNFKKPSFVIYGNRLYQQWIVSLDHCARRKMSNTAWTHWWASISPSNHTKSLPFWGVSICLINEPIFLSSCRHVLSSQLHDFVYVLVHCVNRLKKGSFYGSVLPKKLSYKCHISKIVTSKKIWAGLLLWSYNLLVWMYTSIHYIARFIRKH